MFDVDSNSWIIVPNWPRFQHYSKRTPPWIKLYTELLHKQEFLALNVAERGLLMTIWLEFAASNGQVTAEEVQRNCRGSARSQHWQRLNHAGFIEFSASKPLAQRQREKELQDESAVRDLGKSNGSVEKTTHFNFSELLGSIDDQL